MHEYVAFDTRGHDERVDGVNEGGVDDGFVACFATKVSKSVPKRIMLQEI